MLQPQDRQAFDAILDAEVAALPAGIRSLLEEVPLIVEDEPSAKLMEELELTGPDDDLCGLHDGVPLTERSVEHGATLPEQLMLFRGPILRLARCGRQPWRDDQRAALEREVHVTLLHEIGHHFGLDEDDLERAGYG